MCIIIDTNVLSEVFSKNNSKHANYRPVFNWIFNGQGKIVYGGSKYFVEIKKFVRIFRLLHEIKKAVYIQNELVDEATDYASKKIIHKDFDDQHLVGLLLASGCRLVCTNDTTAIPFLQNRLFFKSAIEPKIYHSKKNVKLLGPRYIAPCCGECKQSTNSQKAIMDELFCTIN